MSVFPPIAAYATRYVVGRRSGAATDVSDFILGHLAVIRDDEGCRRAIIQAIKDAPSLSDDCDAREWRRVLEALADKEQP